MIMKNWLLKSIQKFTINYSLISPHKTEGGRKEVE
jgi:hypothetical protein